MRAHENATMTWLDLAAQGIRNLYLAPMQDKGFIIEVWRSIEKTVCHS